MIHCCRILAVKMILTILQQFSDNGIPERGEWNVFSARVLPEFVSWGRIRKTGLLPIIHRCSVYDAIYSLAIPVVLVPSHRERLPSKGGKATNGGSRSRRRYRSDS